MLSTLALLISWIPGLDLLSPVLLGLAALASGVALVCNLMLALAGEGSWLEVAADGLPTKIAPKDGAIRIYDPKTNTKGNVGFQTQEIALPQVRNVRESSYLRSP